MGGDCAHMVTPNTARGAHTALLDARALREALLSVVPAPGEGTTQTLLRSSRLEEALRLYNAGAIERVNDLRDRGLQRNTLYVPEGGPAAVRPTRELLLREEEA